MTVFHAAFKYFWGSLGKNNKKETSKGQKVDFDLFYFCLSFCYFRKTDAFEESFFANKSINKQIKNKYFLQIFKVRTCVRAYMVATPLSRCFKKIDVAPNMVIRDCNYT